MANAKRKTVTKPATNGNGNGKGGTVSNINPVAAPIQGEHTAARAVIPTAVHAIVLKYAPPIVASIKGITEARLTLSALLIRTLDGIRTDCKGDTERIGLATDYLFGNGKNAQDAGYIQGRISEELVAAGGNKGSLKAQFSDLRLIARKTDDKGQPLKLTDETGKLRPMTLLVKDAKVGKATTTSTATGTQNGKAPATLKQWVGHAGVAATLEECAKVLATNKATKDQAVQLRIIIKQLAK